MAQIFHPSTKVVSKASIIIALLILSILLWVAYEMQHSAYFSGEDEALEQRVPFSHDHHVSGLGIDCRYCHTSLSQSSYAEIPPTHTCMSCHSQVWTNSPLLAPVRSSYAANRPLMWVKVNDVPDFVYFNHGIHVEQGVGCVTCHGRVDKMPLARREQSFFMAWCLDCHREPEKFLRPRSEVFNMTYTPKEPQAILGARLVKEYNINVAQLEDCSICHR